MALTVMSLRRRVLLGCLVVAAVLVTTDIVLASTFRSFLVGRIDQQLVQAADPLTHGRFRNGGQGPRPEAGSTTGEQRFYSEYYIGLAATDGTLARFGPGLREDDLSAPKLSAGDMTGHLSPFGDELRPFTVPSSTGGGNWRVVAVQRTGEDGTLVVGARLADLDATLGRMLGVLAVATVLVLAALAAMAASVLWALKKRAADEDRLRQFVADASHELRTPLTSIRGYAELWRAGGLSDPAGVGDAMRRMEQEAKRMGLLVDDMLLLARLEQGRPLETTPLAFDRLVDDAVRDARAVEPDRPIEADIDPVTVVGDDHRLRQVVGNLLANARFHTPPGTAVHVSLRADRDRVLLVVADDGPGLAPAAAARIFERFYRGDPARTRALGGSGLGLSIVAAITAAHGGRVSVDTAPGEGARFVVELPMAQAPRIRTSVASGT